MGFRREVRDRERRKVHPHSRCPPHRVSPSWPPRCPRTRASYALWLSLLSRRRKPSASLACGWVPTCGSAPPPPCCGPVAQEMRLSRNGARRMPSVTLAAAPVLRLGAHTVLVRGGYAHGFSLDTRSREHVALPLRIFRRRVHRMASLSMRREASCRWRRSHSP